MHAVRGQDKAVVFLDRQGLIVNVELVIHT